MNRGHRQHSVCSTDCLLNSLRTCSKRSACQIRGLLSGLMSDPRVSAGPWECCASEPFLYQGQRFGCSILVFLMLVFFVLVFCFWLLYQALHFGSLFFYLFELFFFCIRKEGYDFSSHGIHAQCFKYCNDVHFSQIITNFLTCLARSFK